MLQTLDYVSDNRKQTVPWGLDLGYGVSQYSVNREFPYALHYTR